MAQYGRVMGFVLFGVGVGLAVAYWLRQQEEAYQQQPRPATPPVKPAPAPQEKEIVLPRKTLDQAEAGDDLTRINGIGPRTADALRAVGITSFGALAKSTPEELMEKLRGLRGLTREKVSNWIEQSAGINA